MTEEPITACQVKPDAIHLYLNKIVWEGPNIIYHWKSQTNAQSKIKLEVASIPRIRKEDGENMPQYKVWYQSHEVNNQHLSFILVRLANQTSLMKRGNIPQWSCQFVDLHFSHAPSLDRWNSLLLVKKLVLEKRKSKSPLILFYFILKGKIKQ